jgi:hypothetical protein
MDKLRIQAPRNEAAASTTDEGGLDAPAADMECAS